MFSRTFADISSNNGDVNLDEYHQGGGIVLAIKATEGKSYINPMHRGQSLHCGLKHMSVVHYHFARPDQGNSPRDEAIHFLRACQGLLGPRDYVVCDIERAAVQGGWKADPAWVVEFDKVVQEFTRFYTIPYLSEATAQLSDQWVHGDNKRLWIAAWGNSLPSVPRGYVLAFHQFTNGVIGPTPHGAPGIGECDMNHVVSSVVWNQIVQGQQVKHR